ncbi:AraC family transcriptional regulator [Domibacillus sp. DTU_2020_1001157_1_SI_ALB_TIR_016]|uniref:AraC family transcriptional regulator n=1 Tax=Domibacillus sp. DTU_2020_1001157_1_SI_ALB_TIR_016 TaxID=3077789 RepID=UPI0028F158F5|nr:helix-turn-helix domain-containing protein [Domibacillus sp. DTU_2020_1001157_1_SI_ALB_TIR_016]WNS78856.1 AraC family transcriptional regulator [Domibacillus sp. DTU_2020_1001157_1_SI_ALB_TIR_016]
MRKIEKLISVCRLLWEAFGLPVFIVNHRNEIVFDQAPLPAHPYAASPISFLSEAPEILDFPYVHTTTYLENFFYFKASDTLILAGGPCLYEEMNDLRLGGLTNDLTANQTKLADYYRQLPVLTKRELKSAARIAYFMIHGREEQVAEKKIGITVENPAAPVSRRKQSLSFHHDPFHEKKLMNAIKKGVRREVVKLVQEGPEDGGEYGVLSKSSYVRSQKNLAIASITMATRAAMDGGLDSELAYTLSDLYIQRLEDLHDVRQVQQLIEDALGTFADRVKEAKTNAVSSVISRCQHYILQHVYDEIRLKDLADYVKLSPSYLSSCFKKETGTSISEWIQKARIEEAESLLLLSSYTIADICSWLHFTDQSYFTKVFKKHTGLTPKRYRESGVPSS